jgi:hypothetical protein
MDLVVWLRSLGLGKYYLHVVPKLILIAMRMPLTPMLAKISPDTRLRISTPGRPISPKISPAKAKMQKTKARQSASRPVVSAFLQVTVHYCRLAARR